MQNIKTTAKILGQLPRFSIEAIGFGGMIIFILYSLMKNDTFKHFALVALYAFGGYGFYQPYNNHIIQSQVCVIQVRH